MMKKSMAVFAAVAGFSMGALPTVAAAQISVDFETALVSSYAWRGWQLTDAPVVQPSLTLGLGETGIALNIWGSAAITDRDTFEGADELDFTLSYDVALAENAGLSIGYIQYTFPNGADGAGHSEETFASFSMDHTLVPSVLVAYDFGLMEAFYASAGVGPEFALGETAVLGLGASVAMSDYTGELGFNDLQGSASVGLSAGGVAITPFAGVSYSAEEIFADQSQFWGGVTVGYSW